MDQNYEAVDQHTSQLKGTHGELYAKAVFAAALLKLCAEDAQATAPSPFARRLEHSVHAALVVISALLEEVGRGLVSEAA